MCENKRLVLFGQKISEHKKSLEFSRLQFTKFFNFYFKFD